MSGGGAASEFGHPLRKFKLVFLGEQSGKPTPRDYLGQQGLLMEGMDAGGGFFTVEGDLKALRPNDVAWLAISRDIEILFHGGHSL